MNTLLEIDGIDEIDKAIRFFKLVPKAHGYAMAKTMNDAGRAAYTAASKNMRRVWNIKAGYASKKGTGATGLKDLVRIKRATSGNLEYVFHMEGRSIPLLYFGARDLRASGRGVSYKLKKVGARNRVAKAFIATSRTRNRPYVLVRKTHDRYPLRPLASITPPTMFLNTESDDVFWKAYMKSFKKNYARNAEFYYKQFRGG